MEKLRDLTKRIGFWQTLQILSQYNRKITIKNFNNQLNKISYYNAFYRIEPQMLKFGIISNSDGKIGLTNKGKNFLLMLERANDLLEAS